MRLFVAKGLLLAGTLGAVICLAFNSSSSSFAQDAKPAAKAGDKPAAKETAKEGDAKKPAKPGARLPAYYGEVVSKEQREKIYKIQEAFAVKRDELAAQLKAITAQRDADVAAVLTAEQLKKVAELEAAAKAKAKETKEAKSSEAKSPDAKPAAEQPKPAAKKPAAKP